MATIIVCVASSVADGILGPGDGLPLWARSRHAGDLAGGCRMQLQSDTRGHEAVPAPKTRARTNTGLDARMTTHLIVATSRGCRRKSSTND